MKKGSLFNIPVSARVASRIYSPRNCFICSYARAKEMQEAILKQIEEVRPELKLSSAVPKNVVYYIDQYGNATKYEIVEDENE